MRAGTLRHTVTLQSPGGTKDAFGSRLTTWDDVADVPASVEPISGREQFLAAQRQATTSHIVTIRYGDTWSDIDATWRIKFGARVFTIDAPPRNTEERNKEIILTCTEGPRQE